MQALDIASDPRFLELIDRQDENWMECCFVGERGPDGFRIPWSPPQFVEPVSSTAWSWGTWAACDFISFMRTEPRFDPEYRLGDMVEAMAGRELSYAEKAFFYGLSTFIARGRIPASGRFDLVPAGDLPASSEEAAT
jgi:hypothetical protein